MAEHTPRALTVQWHLTERCNLRCSHCYQHEPCPPELDLDGLLAIVEQVRDLVRRWGARAPGRLRRVRFTLTGGEPLLRPECLTLLRLLRDDPWPWATALLTNGTLIDRAIARELATLRVGFVQVSLEGGSATHDAIRGAGSHAAACAGLRELVRAGVRTSVAFTAHRGNHAEFGAVARLCRRLRVDTLWADRLVPAGRGAALAAAVLTPVETAAFGQALRRAAHAGWPWQRRTRVSCDRALQFLAGDGAPYRCNAGADLLALLPTGDVLPCRRLPIVVGNVGQTPLADLYDEAELLRQLRDRERIPGRCVACAHARTCGGGLRCLAYAVTGDPWAADPGCWLARG